MCPTSNCACEQSLSVDLNQGAGSVLERLQAECALDADAPTLVVVEAVLFYLAPPAKSKLLTEISALLASQPVRVRWDSKRNA